MKSIYLKIFFIATIVYCSSSDDESTDSATNATDQTRISAKNPKKTYAQLNITSDKTQILKSSSESVLSGAEVSFPPNCLSSDSKTTEVFLEEGVDTYFEIGVSDFENLTREDIDRHEASLLLTTSDTSLDFSCDFTIDFPLKKIMTTNLSEDTNAVLFFHVFDKDLEVYISGFKKISDVKDTIQIKANQMGAYQILTLKTPLVKDLKNEKSLQQEYLPKANDITDNSQVVVNQKNIIVGGGSQTGQAPTAILFDDSEVDPSVNERSPKHTLISTLSVVDNDQNDSFVFYLSGQDRDYFYIANDKLYVNKIFQYTEGATKNITISVSDSFGFTYSQNIMVIINNMHPTKILLNNQSELNIDEYTPVGTVVANLTPNQGGFNDSNWTYTLSGTDAGYFTIDGLTLKIATLFYYMDIQSLDISLKIDDQYGISYSEDFTISINNLAPELSLSGASVHAGKNPGIAVGTLSSNESGVTFSLVSGNGDTDNDDFMIDGSTLRTSKTLSYASGSSRSIRVRASDIGLTYEEIFTITVQENTDQPEELILSATSGTSNTGITNAWQKINSGSKTLTSVNFYFDNDHTENNYYLYLNVYDTDNAPSSANPWSKFSGNPVVQSDTVMLPKNTSAWTEFKFTIDGESLSLNTDYYIFIKPDHGSNLSWTYHQGIKKYGDSSTTGGAGNNFGKLNHEVYGIDP